MTPKSLVLFLTFALCVNFILTQCPSISSTSIEAYYLNNCASGIPKFPEDDVLSSVSTTFSLIAKVKGGTYANITNLVPGAVYEFTTCGSFSVSPFNCPSISFDPVMVLRDADGDVVGSNDDCNCVSCGSAANKNSFVSYTHPSLATSSWITVGVFASSSNPNCKLTYYGRNLYLPLFQRQVSGGTCNSYSLTCKDATLNLGSTSGTITVSSVLSSISTSTSCGLTVTANVTTLDCDDAGKTVPIKVSLYDRSCVSYVTVKDVTAPTLNSCGGKTLIYSRSDFDGEEFCRPGSYCAVDVYAIFPPQLTIKENCDFDYYPQSSVDRFQDIGVTFNYNVVVYDPSGNSNSISCPYVVTAIHILNIVDESNFFPGTPYDIYVQYKFPAMDDLYVGLLPIGYRRDQFLKEVIEIDYDFFNGNVLYDDISAGVFVDVIFPNLDDPNYELVIYGVFNSQVIIVSINNPVVSVSGIFFESTLETTDLSTAVVLTTDFSTNPLTTDFSTNPLTTDFSTNPLP